MHGLADVAPFNSIAARAAGACRANTEAVVDCQIQMSGVTLMYASVCCLCCLMQTHSLAWSSWVLKISICAEVYAATLPRQPYSTHKNVKRVSVLHDEGRVPLM
jgi:hypothetical protein